VYCRFLAFATVTVSLARPLAANAEIIIRTEVYPNQQVNSFASAANAELVRKAVYFLAANPGMANHPISRYLYNPELQAEIVFNSPGLASKASAISGNQLHVKSDADFAYYLTVLAKEFIHMDIAEKYSQSMNYSFLHPQDYAFQILMEEAFANTMKTWLRLNYPEEMNSDFRIKNAYQLTDSTAERVTDARRNDLRSSTRQSEAQITNQVIGEIFDLFMSGRTFYSLTHINNMTKVDYGEGTTFLVPEYAAYRERGDALLRHQWNYLVSIVPYTLPDYITYETYRRLFAQYSLASWVTKVNSPENHISHWENYPYEDRARARIANKNPRDIHYDFLSREDEARLNRVMQEIDPAFEPVRTDITSIKRMFQEHYERIFEVTADDR